MAQVWLVTGSSRGLGRAIVEAGLAAGNKVLATARDIESLHDLSERHGDQIKLFALDVTDESAAASAVKSAIGAFGSLEVVINNAGYGNLSSVEDIQRDLSEFAFGVHSILGSDRGQLPAACLGLLDAASDVLDSRFRSGHLPNQDGLAPHTDSPAELALESPTI